MPGRKIIFIRCILNEEVHAFRSTVEDQARRHANLHAHFRYSDPAGPGVERQGSVSTGFVDAALIESLVPERDADYYFCGPQPFMVGTVSYTHLDVYKRQSSDYLLCFS